MYSVWTILFCLQTVGCDEVQYMDYFVLFADSGLWWGPVYGLFCSVCRQWVVMGSSIWTILFCLQTVSSVWTILFCLQTVGCDEVQYMDYFVLFADSGLWWGPVIYMDYFVVFADRGLWWGRGIWCGGRPVWCLWWEEPRLSDNFRDLHPSYPTVWL
jgi:hypothetical protein